MKSGWSSFLFASFVAVLVSSIHDTAAADLFGGDEYLCSSAITGANKTVVLQLEGNTSFVETKEGQKNLEDSFQTAYNSLSFSICDAPHFRSILDVSVSGSELVGGGVNVEGTTFVVTLDVVVDCRNCTEDIPLFESLVPASFNFTGVSNTTVQETALVVSKKETRLRNGSAHKQLLIGDIEDGGALSSCSCPTNTPPNPQGLTPDGFLPLFNQELATNFDENVKVVNFEELQQVSCGADVETFTSFVFLKIGLEGKATPPLAELDALEQAFVETYNSISFGTCDPYFRSVTSAKIELDGREYAGGQSRRLQDQLVDDIAMYTVEGNGTNILGGNFTNITALFLNATLNATEDVDYRGSVMFAVTGQWWVELFFFFLVYHTACSPCWSSCIICFQPELPD